MSVPARVTLFEMGPRDGLQNEAQAVTVETKVALVERLAGAGLTRIETGSFVSPKWVPQMADSAEVFARIERAPGVRYTALTPNLKGLEAAIAAKVDEVAVFAAASESFSRRNINCSVAESLERFRPVVEAARAAGLPVRGYVSCVLGCPFDGEIAPGAVAEVTRELDAMGCYAVSLGDTIGVGTPRRAQAMIEACARVVPVDRLAIHFHDTCGQALANILACLELGVAVVDASVATRSAASEADDNPAPQPASTVTQSAPITRWRRPAAPRTWSSPATPPSPTPGPWAPPPLSAKSSPRARRT